MALRRNRPDGTNNPPKKKALTRDEKIERIRAIEQKGLDIAEKLSGKPLPEKFREVAIRHEKTGDKEVTMTVIGMEHEGKLHYDFHKSVHSLKEVRGIGTNSIHYSTTLRMAIPIVLSAVSGDIKNAVKTVQDHLDAVEAAQDCMPFTIKLKASNTPPANKPKPPKP